MILKLIEGVDVVVDPKDIKSVYRGPDQFTGEPQTKVKTTWMHVIDRTQPGSPEICLITTNPLHQFLNDLFLNLLPQAS